MSEFDQQPDAMAEVHSPEQDTVGLGDFEAPATGVSAVDDVLRSVAGLDTMPVEEHVAVFEQAHDRLRRALDPGHG